LEYISTDIKLKRRNVTSPKADGADGADGADAMVNGSFRQTLITLLPGFSLQKLTSFSQPHKKYPTEKVVDCAIPNDTLKWLCL
jgi:hypothetical protein